MALGSHSAAVCDQVQSRVKSCRWTFSRPAAILKLHYPLNSCLSRHHIKARRRRKEKREHVGYQYSAILFLSKGACNPPKCHRLSTLAQSSRGLNARSDDWAEHNFHLRSQSLVQAT